MNGAGLPISFNYFTGEHFSTVAILHGETIRIVVDGRPCDLVYHEEPYRGDYGAEYPSISLRRA